MRNKTKSWYIIYMTTVFVKLIPLKTCSSRILTLLPWSWDFLVPHPNNH